MAQFSQQEQDRMRRDAARRAREMQRSVYAPARRTSPYADYPPHVSDEPPPARQEEPFLHTQKFQPPPPRQPQKSMGTLFPAGFLPQLNPGELLSKLDGDSMLIIALMVMLYKNGGQDGCDKKLLMALAYLLT